MFKKILKKIIGDKSSRELKKIRPMVDEINTIYSSLSKLSDDELRNRVKEIRGVIQKEISELSQVYSELEENYLKESDDKKRDDLSNELDRKKEELKKVTEKVLKDYMFEVFAIVKDTCRRLIGYKYQVRGNEEIWNMVPYDVQLIGAISLHNGSIAEMATGEGKTLVATLPLFLNALTGKGVHLITVNDYLAQRDSEWMKPIFDFHNLTVSVIYNNMPHEERKAAYNCDITYGTNSEFGFDYLRDNMAIDADYLYQRAHFYAIVDEVDSVLIDEARTPLIISGPVPESKNYFHELKPLISKIVNSQNVFINRLVSEVKNEMKKDEPNWDEIGNKLLLVKRGAPKNKTFLKLMKDGDTKKLVNDVEGEYLRDKKLHEVDEKLFFVVDEKANSADLMEKGQKIIEKQEKDLFTMEEFNDHLIAIENNENLSREEKTKQKDILTNDYLVKSEKLHNIQQLLKAYTLFNKDMEYVVQDNKVMIVDEFTGRLMPGRRFSDGLHQALEAKEGVKIEEASQTLATITLQNYFRMYDKLAGMTGTAATEESEFMEIYKLPVNVIPTNKPISRIDHEDVIYISKKDKYNAIIKEIEYWHSKNQPVLVGTVTVDVSETLSRLLKIRKIKHNVLNAKFNEYEAEIVAMAGQAGAVTIATNMAGRGTDIKLGEGVVKRSKEEYLNKNWKPCDELPYGGPLNGLHVIGTERHESRRIDRQLRGRSGRQGDPGTSRFYLSLEDDLMRLFGSDKIAPMMTKLGMKEDEAIVHPWMTSSVGKAQKRVEMQNFEIRKQLIKYDEVMNQQREVIYSYRRKVLKGFDLKSDIVDMIRETIANVVDNIIEDNSYEETWELESIRTWFLTNFNVKLPEDIFKSDHLTKRMVFEILDEYLLKTYDEKEKEMTSEQMRELERRSLLSVVDEEWQDHLREMDFLKDGIGLRAYANKDPLIEYKKESYDLFTGLISRIQENVSKKVFTTYLLTTEQLHSLLENSSFTHSEMSAFSPAEIQERKNINNKNKVNPPKIQPRHVEIKVGRNDPCPCGSGKKYKNCCGKLKG
jgi:preprotein translocase subunit SecA